MNDIRNVSCSYNLCNLSSANAQIVKKFRCVRFTIYSGNVTNWSNYDTAITIATGLPWSNTFANSTVYEMYNRTNILGYVDMNGGTCNIHLKSNTTFYFSHCYLI